MDKNIRHSVGLWGRWVMVVALICSMFPGRVGAQAPTHNLVVDFTTFEVPVELWEPIETALETHPELLPETERFTVSAFETYENWFHAVVVPTSVVEAGWEVDLSALELTEILGYQDLSGVWITSVLGAPDFIELATNVPTEFMDYSTRLTMTEQSSTQLSAVEYLFPWSAGEKWRRTRGYAPVFWHTNSGQMSSYGSALDFTPDRAAPVVAAAPGTLIRYCRDDYQSALKITDENGYTSRYLHIATSSIPGQIIGKQVARGQFLGKLYDGTQGRHGDLRFDTSCGRGTIIHLHFDFPTQSMKINGRNARDVAASAGPYKSANTRIDLTKCPAPGDPNAVILYYGYDTRKKIPQCRYESPESLGYVKIPVIQSYKDLGGFQTSFVSVPDQYEIVLEDANANERVYFPGNHSFARTSFLSIKINECPRPSYDYPVIVYAGLDYHCNGQEEGRGYARVPRSALTNVFYLPISFRALSVQTAPGFLATLYPYNESILAEARRSSPGDPYFSDDPYQPCNAASPSSSDCLLFANVGRIRLIENPVICAAKTTNKNSDQGSFCLPNQAPYVPTLKSPDNSYTTRDSNAPTLCWTSKGDPNGDSVDFKIEVYNGSYNVTSGWIQSRCWRPAQLDRVYGSYSWHVQARDLNGAVSVWSSGRSFKIAPSNRTPVVSFDTANGNEFLTGFINSNEADWTFMGTASDPENRPDRIVWRCSGDNCGTMIDQNGVSNWMHERQELSGRNTITFRVYDKDGHYSTSRSLTLYIDRATPQTQITLNDSSNTEQWPAWFGGPVEAQLKAVDQGTGRAKVGVQEIHYRVDNGNWQVRGGDLVNFTVQGDGAHTVEYYAVDKVGNVESTHTINLQIDQLAPSSPSGVVETHGVVNGVWQKISNVPTFTWNAATDAVSGIWGYQFYFGTDPAGTGLQEFRADQPREWTPLSSGLPTGVYYLRGRTRDNAGHWSAWTNLFTFRYDGTAPQNPGEITHGAGITNAVWQRATTAADFTWIPARDEGSGLKGYYFYWGTDPAGVSTTLITATSFQNPQPLCSGVSVCTGYLRLQSVDNADTPAVAWTTGFVLKYDNAPPAADFTFNNGMTMTGQTLVRLNLAATDQGSGVAGMRFSADGSIWTAWEAYTTTREWNLPPVNRQSWPVYLQVRDGVGLESNVISHSIYLDATPQQPRSASFRLFDYLFSAGAGAYTSTLYIGRGTLGQVADSAVMTSSHYRLWSGYEAASQALPLVLPAGEETVNGAPFISANIAAMSAQSEEAAAVVAASLCDVPYVHINEDAPFTNQATVTLSLCAPVATEMWVSNGVSPALHTWEPYAMTKTWILSDTGLQTEARYVYVGFKDADDAVYNTYFDSIRLDTIAPTFTLTTDAPMIGPEDVITVEEPFTDTLPYALESAGAVVRGPSLSATGSASQAVTLYTSGMDANSGIPEIQISEDISFTDAFWQPFTSIHTYTPAEEDGVVGLYTRVRDGAGNVSAVNELLFIYDINPPEGELSMEAYVLPADAVTNTVYLEGGDSGVGIDAVRISYLSDFSDAIWEPYTSEVTLPLSFTMSMTDSEEMTLPVEIVAQDVYTLYVQYRDGAGHISEVYSDTFRVDNTPPAVFALVAPEGILTDTAGITFSVHAVTVYADDNLSGVSTVYLSNDPWMEEGVVSYTYSYDTPILWPFDESLIAWMQVEDGMGNLSEPYLVTVESESENYLLYLPIVMKHQ